MMYKHLLSHVRFKLKVTVTSAIQDVNASLTLCSLPEVEVLLV